MLQWGINNGRGQEWHCSKNKTVNDAALYTHCYDHALNLAVNDCNRNTKDNVWVMQKEIYNLVKKSP